MKTFDDFLEIYTLKENTLSPDTGCEVDGKSRGFETYGRDFSYVLEVMKATPNRVWQIDTGDDETGKQLLTQGYDASKDVLLYLITNEDFDGGDDTFVYSDDEEMDDDF